MATAGIKPITAEEFYTLSPELGDCELVQGEIVTMTPPGFRYGHICRRVSKVVGNHVDDHDLGWLICNDSGMLTQRNPATVRGPDVSYFSYERLPRGEPLSGYPPVPADVVWEVLSPFDQAKDTSAKVAEYLAIGVRAVCVIDPDQRIVTTYTPGETPQVLSAADSWSLPEVFPDWKVPVTRWLP